MNRRTFVRTTGAAAAIASAAGCIGGDEPSEGDGDAEGGADAVPDLRTVEDPPDVVYVPTHRESMRALDPVEAGEYTLAPMLSYPHRFWLVSGTETQPVDPEQGRGVHLMFTLWDAETGIVLPVDSGAEIRVFRDGERVGSPRAPWTMISQGMGFHFGDNVPLPADGEYAVEVTVPPLSVETTGDLAGRFTESATLEFSFVYDDEFRREVVDGIEYVDEEYWGRPGALEPMHGDHGDEDHDGNGDEDRGDDDDEGRGHDGRDGDGEGEHDDDHGAHEDHDDHGDGGAHAGHGRVPYSSLPPADAYPGTLLGEPKSGDATFVTTLLEPGSRFVDGDERYLLVSPRTPYNRVPLADTSLTVEIERDGETVTDGPRPLVQRIDDEFDLHYGVALEDVEPGDAVTIGVESPPQVARHQGYETAFLDMAPVELTVPEEGS